MARLGDVCEKRVDTIKATYEGDIDYIDISSVDNQRKEITQTQSMSIADAPSRAKQLVFPGDILVSTVRPNLNAVALVTENSDNTLVASTGYCVLRCLPNVDNKYVFYFCQSPAFIDKMVAQATGASYPAVTSAIVKECTIPLPPLEEQRRIAALLDRVSDLIAKRRAQLDKLDLLVKARFVEMFGDPGSNPMRWDTVELSHCLSGIDNGKSLVCDTKPRQGNWPAILKLSAATYGYYQPEENKAMLNENEFVNSAEVQVGDLLFTRKNTPELVGMCAYVYETPGKLMMPDLIFRLNTNETCNRIFLWKLINHDLFRENIKAISSGSAKSMSNISKERLCELKIILPPIELQQQFVDFVRQTDQSKLTIQQSLDKLETLKKALMQQYFGDL